MDALWAPWRLEYILGDKEKGCFFCKAAKSSEDEKHLVLWRGATCFCIMNRYPYNNGHLMVAPFRHRGKLETLRDAELQELMTLTRDAQRVLTSAMRPDGFNLGANLGKVAGAGVVGHFHFHIVPRWTGDTNFMPVIADTKVVPQALGDLFGTLQREFVDLLPGER